MQLTRGTPAKVGHHCRTKWALSGYHGGDGNGFAEVVGCVELGDVTLQNWAVESGDADAEFNAAVEDSNDAKVDADEAEGSGLEGVS